MSIKSDTVLKVQSIRLTFVVFYITVILIFVINLYVQNLLRALLVSIKICVQFSAVIFILSLLSTCNICHDYKNKIENN